VSAVRASEPRRSTSAPAAWAAIHTDSPRVEKILARARADLQTLRSEQSGHAYFAAGVPWFAALFGRDSLITGLQVLPFERGTSEGTLRLLAEYEGRTIDPARASSRARSCTNCAWVSSPG